MRNVRVVLWQGRVAFVFRWLGSWPKVLVAVVTTFASFSIFSDEICQIRVLNSSIENPDLTTLLPHLRPEYWCLPMIALDCYSLHSPSPFMHQKPAGKMQEGFEMSKGPVRLSICYLLSAT